MLEIDMQINDTDPQSWNDLVNKSNPDPYNIHQTYEWAMLQKRANGFTPIFVRVMNNSEVCGGQLYFKRNAFGIFPEYKSYGGPLCTNGNISEIGGPIIDHLLSNGRRSFSADLRTGFFPELNSHFVNKRLIRHPAFPYMISLEGTEEDLWNKLSVNTRKTIKRGINRGVVIEEAKAWDQWLNFYGIYKDHCERKGLHSNNLAFFKEIYEQFVPKKLAKLFIALYDGAVVAGDLEFFYGKVMTDHTKASDMRYDKYSTNDVMAWNLILYGNRNGFSTLDLDDTWPDPKSPFHGVHKFKDKWNGHMVETNDYYLGKAREVGNYQGKAYVLGKMLAEKKRITENKFSTLIQVKRGSI